MAIPRKKCGSMRSRRQSAATIGCLGDLTNTGDSVDFIGTKRELYRIVWDLYGIVWDVYGTCMGLLDRLIHQGKNFDAQKPKCQGLPMERLPFHAPASFHRPPRYG